TVRGEGGLALSSRNKRLSEEERSLASNLYKTLSEIKESYGKADVSILKLSYLEKLNQLENTKVEYIDIVDYQSLKCLKEWNPKGENLAILAVYIGEVRLIDNLLF
ncbi:MAG TPA: pantoate--beta-alanine ligase, partial [Chitinophagales bacterium]|nr:pantoate--beta-alanine ligase [Chitinophagales bacterium]